MLFYTCSLNFLSTLKGTIIMYIMYNTLQECFNANTNNSGFIYYDCFTDTFRFCSKQTASMRLVAILD